MGQKPGQQQKEELAIQIKFLRAIFYQNKGGQDKKNIRLELGMDEIKNGIGMSKLRGYVMRMGEESISNKMLHTKLKGKRPRGRSRALWIDQI